MNTEVPKVSIIILNWNGWKDTVECLESIYQIDYTNYNVIVADNDSQDTSLDKIKKYSEGILKVESELVEYNSQNKPLEVFEFSEKEYINPENIKTDFNIIPSDKKLILLKNQQNHGYAKGNNLAMDFALKKLDSEYILILNNDTVVDASFLNHLVETIEENPHNGIIGPTVYYYHQKDKISIFGGNINMYTGRTNYPSIDTKDPFTKSEIDYVSGSCLLIKKGIIKEIGLLKSQYFLYYEDVEWCFRARKSGYRIIYEPKARIWHKESVTAQNPTGVYYLFRNRIWFMREYATPLQYLVFFTLSILYFTYKILIFANNKKLLKALFFGIKDGYQKAL